MRTRTTFLACGAWLVVVGVLAGASLLGAWTRAAAAERADFGDRYPAMIGAAGTFVLLGWACLWTKWWFDRRA